MKVLIVNADDFGLTPEVNRGIVDAHLAGSVTSTTLMVNMPAADDAAALAKSNPALGVGLHFNITLGRPLAEVGSVSDLVDRRGEFHSRRALAVRLLSGQVRAEHVRRELLAQCQALLDLGIRPSHIDSHQHVHVFPLVFEAVAAFCEQEGLPMRMPWLLKVRDRRPRVGRAFRQWLLGRMLASNMKRWQGRVAWNSCLGSVFDLGSLPEQPTLADYRLLLESAGEGVFELMVHLVPDAEAVRGLTRIGDISAAEWRALSRPGLDRLAAELGFQMRTFAEAFPREGRLQGAAS